MMTNETREGFRRREISNCSKAAVNSQIHHITPKKIFLIVSQSYTAYFYNLYLCISCYDNLSGHSEALLSDCQ